MRYAQAVGLREEILRECPTLSGKLVRIISLKLKAQQPMFKLHIINANFECMLRLEELAEKHQLSVEDKYGVCIVLNPARRIDVNAN
jgi:hypothetical protein